MDDSKNICDGEHKLLFEIRDVSGILCKKILADLLGRQHLLEILQTSLAFENSKKVAKSGCFEKLFRWRAPILFRNEEGM